MKIEINLRDIIKVYESLFNNNIDVDHNIINALTKLGISISDSEYCYYTAKKNLNKKDQDVLKPDNSKYGVL